MDDDLGAPEGPAEAPGAPSGPAAGEPSGWASLAEALGLDPPEPALQGPEAEAFLASAAARARELSESERRSRQAASGYRAAGLALSGSLEMGQVLEAILDYLNWAVAYDGAAVLLLPAVSHNLPGAAVAVPVGAAGASGAVPLVSAASREWRREAPRGPSAEDLSLVAAALREGRPRASAGGRLARLALPLAGPEGPLGVILVLREGAAPYSEAESRAAEAFAGQSAAAVRNAALFGALRAARDELVAAYDASMELLSRALDLRDHETEGHSLRVAALAERLGVAVGLGAEELLHLRRGALLHDIGKIGVSDAVLRKPGPLDEAELAEMRRHPVLARELLAGVAFLAPAVEVAACHHERWDGRGYPAGLRGEGIPRAARVFAVADVWDALTCDRPYRRALGAEEARRQLAAEAGSTLDPAMVAAFLALDPAP